MFSASKPTVLALIASLLVVCCVCETVPDEPYQQDIATIFQYGNLSPLADWKMLPMNSSTPITQVTPTGPGEINTFFTLTTTSLYITSTLTQTFRRIDVGLGLTITPQTRVRAYSLNGVVVANQHTLTLCKDIQQLHAADGCKPVQAPGWGDVNDIVVDVDRGNVWVATDNGLFFYNDVSASIEQVKAVDAVPMSSVSLTYLDGAPVPRHFRVATGGVDKLWISNVDASRWRYEWVIGVVDAPITALQFDKHQNLWIGNSDCINLMHNNGTFQRISGQKGGLPSANVSCLAADSNSGSVYVGTMFGASRRLDGRWKYYYGPRWLPGRGFTKGQNVSAITSLTLSPQETLVIVTDTGMSIITFKRMTLKQKADHYQSLVYPRHDRYGLTSNVGLQKFGDLSSYVKQTSDNDGLWTSIYLASQCFRYAVTKDPQAKADADRAFSGLQFLNNITGVHGLMARSLWPGINPPAGTGGTWHNSTTDPGFVWKGDTSSDEVVGHLFALPLYYDLVAETQQEKQAVYSIIDAITSYIVTNDYYLIDVTGKPTTWGVWNPTYLNDNKDWFDERGLNAMQITSWLLSAYRITNNQTYLDSFHDLVDNYGYGYNIVNQKITDPPDYNYSDDELAFLPYFTYIWTNSTELKEFFDLSITRAWNLARKEKSSLWNVIFGAAGLSDDFAMRDAVETLQQWPLSQINWPVQNSQRLDVFLDANLSRQNTNQSLNLLPYDERSMFRWNGSPFDLDQGSGTTEYDPSAWLLPYWAARYYNFLS